jgi:hypothetical protein
LGAQGLLTAARELLFLSISDRGNIARYFLITLSPCASAWSWCQKVCLVLSIHLGVRISRFGPTSQVSYPVQPALFFLSSLSSQFLGYNSISQFLI